MLRLLQLASVGMAQLSTWRHSLDLFGGFSHLDLGVCLVGVSPPLTLDPSFFEDMLAPRFNTDLSMQ